MDAEPMVSYDAGVDFERARQPEQKEQRREAILDAAAALLEERGLADVSLSAIARRAELSKANLYRYFESREAIFLELLLSDYRAIAEEFEQALVPLAGSGDVDAVAREVARALVSRPRALDLLSSISSVLERNVSPEVIRGFKREMTLIGARPVFALHAAIPALPVEDAQRAMHAMVIFAGGLYPSTNPAPAVAEVMSEPEFAHLCVDLESGVEEHARLLLRGFLAS
jgi:AcrR family transcriptional regulator